MFRSGTAAAQGHTMSVDGQPEAYTETTSLLPRPDLAQQHLAATKTYIEEQCSTVANTGVSSQSRPGGSLHFATIQHLAPHFPFFGIQSTATINSCRPKHAQLRNQRLELETPLEGRVERRGREMRQGEKEGTRGKKKNQNC